MKHNNELWFLLTDLDYILDDETEQPIIRLFGRKEDKQLMILIRDFLPYFYVNRTTELEYILKADPGISYWLQKTEEVTKRKYFWAGKSIPLVKLLGKDPTKIFTLSKELEKLGIETFETDIGYLKRFLIDTNIKCLNVIAVQPTAMQEKGREIILEASYKDLSPVPETSVRSADLFYQLKIMAVSVKVQQQHESKEELLASNKRPIVALTCVWGTELQPKGGKCFLLKEENMEEEKRTIMNFLQELQSIQPDILITFQGDSFDLPYLFRRMRKLAIPTQLFSLFKTDSCYYSHKLFSYRMKGRISFDLNYRTWGIHPSSGRKNLEDITQEVLQKNRISLDEPLQTLWEKGMQQEEKEAILKLTKYCFTDCKLIYDLYWGLGLNGWIEVLRTTGFPTAEASSCTERINGEFELMRYMKRKGVLIPKRPDNEQVERNRLIREANPHEGGTVLYPKGTLHTGVVIADFKSMYPSVMIAENIGGETLKQWVEASNIGNPKKLFHKQSRSCLAIMEKTLIEKRVAKKQEIAALLQELEKTTDNTEREQINNRLTLLDREQNSMKIVANSMYGAHFYIRSRFYTQTLAAAIADSARSYLLGIRKQLQKVSEKIVACELIYGDTDSAFIKVLDEELFTSIYLEENEEKKQQLLTELITLVQKILAELNKSLPPPIELKFENIAYRVIFKPRRKKAYSYLSLLDEEINITGFEAVRSDWSPLARTAQQKVLEILLRHPNGILKKSIRQRQKDAREEFVLAKRFLISLGAKILQMSVEELLPKVVILSPIKRHPKKYKAKTPAVEAFLNFAFQEKLDANKEWMNYDKFPWVITAGKGLIYDRARHPKYVQDIDREHYVKEILRSCETLGVKVTLAEVKQVLPDGALETVLDKLEKQQTRNNAKTILPYKPGELERRKSTVNKKRSYKHIVAAGQAVLSQYLETEEKEENGN
jgi:DNA polymerase I